MIKTEDKFKICRKYRVYLEIIFILGNGVILQKQFYEICKKLYISRSDYQTRKILSELEKLQIIKKQNFLYSKNKVIILKKFAIRFLLNKKYSNQVASIPKSIDKRIITSVFKLDRVIKVIDVYGLYDWNNFLDKMYDLNSTLIYNKTKGIFYHQMLMSKYDLNLYEQEMYIRGLENYNNMLRDLEYGRKKKFNDNEISFYNVDRDNIKFLNKRNKINDITIDKLINSNIHIESITDLVDTKVVEVVVMDVNNTQNINQIIDGIMMSCIAIKEIFKRDNISFRFKIIMWDNIAKKNVKSILAKKNINQEHNYIRRRLSTYKVDGRNVLLDLKLDINDIKISISHIDIYKKYLGNINFLNKN